MMSPQEEINQIIGYLDSIYDSKITWNVFVGRTNDSNLISYITNVYKIESYVFQPKNLLNDPDELIKLMPSTQRFIHDTSILTVIDEYESENRNLLFYVPITR